MQRYFVNNEQIIDRVVTINGSDAHHISRVMRMQPEQQIIVCNQEQQAFLAVLTDVTHDVVIATLGEELIAETELPARIILVQGLPKGDKFEFIVQKATELGVDTIIPWASERAIVKLDEKKAPKKQQRWQAIAKEAAEQAHRVMVPTVEMPQTTAQLMVQFEHADLLLVAYEELTHDGVAMEHWAAKLLPGTTVVIVIGPEGGISAKEFAALQAAGAQAIQLGKRILRTETAALYALSIAGYYLENE
ncbi:16S rRNA (uracil(1498)-N(3))-methyltransferase [Culicoidibacter larvae]|uniref:Ribosomal RNA small subunit methyltransferase E n=1 Tax=Culicoidibacter larvae TaxID=2579976 RepID=A0A5R8QFQ0_9FIRM|nr:16S rRNA (uracil(1498)-N(3))-methyltransferase [Culicoidibacter larvae]TLG76566.1 16S rRNA (uracil(1498)-N(3))-methyltransferase [Culicoidibacter larvae]